ncbi:MAG: 50S ribosomal protein L4 [Gemmatimonadetes bacterium]|nr:50S ribosomal protein L4 [Gemmatimonadota bacterium]
MYKARYYKADGKKGRARPLPDWLFDGIVNEAAMHRAVVAYQANQRQGTAAAKSRGQVSGGGRKPWRQKGTGRARQGTIRAPQWPGGGVAHPPMPRDWRQQLPKKVRQLARRSAFNARAEADRIIIVEPLELEQPKTKRMIELIETVGAEDRVLLLTDGHKPLVYLSARNLPDVVVRSFGAESIYDLLWAGTVVIERPALERAGSVAAEDAEDLAQDEKGDEGA